MNKFEVVSVSLLIVYFFLCGVLVITMFHSSINIYIIGKNQVLENNSIVYLIETPEGFYTISQLNYYKLKHGYCEVILSNKTIMQFNHNHFRCNYTEDISFTI